MARSDAAATGDNRAGRGASSTCETRCRRDHIRPRQRAPEKNKGAASQWRVVEARTRKGPRLGVSDEKKRGGTDLVAGLLAVGLVLCSTGEGEGGRTGGRMSKMSWRGTRKQNKSARALFSRNPLLLFPGACAVLTSCSRKLPAASVLLHFLHLRQACRTMGGGGRSGGVSRRGGAEEKEKEAPLAKHFVSRGFLFSSRSPCASPCPAHGRARQSTRLRCGVLRRGEGGEGGKRREHGESRWRRSIAGALF